MKLRRLKFFAVFLLILTAALFALAVRAQDSIAVLGSIGVFSARSVFPHGKIRMPLSLKRYGVIANEREAWRFPPASGEARCLFALAGRDGYTLETLRGLIRIAPVEQAILREFARRFPELAERVERALIYRARVEQEFERLAKQCM